MTQPREEWRLDTNRLGRRVLVFDELPSTSDYAAKLAHDPANDGVVVLADTQTAGRGQHGRTWTAAPGSSVLLSLLLFPPPAIRRPAILTAWAAVSVCQTIRTSAGIEIDAAIKWPNDVLVGGKKVCGILIEQGHGTVVGIGLNVRQTAAEFEAANLLQAASLAQFAAAPPDTAATARELVRQLDREYVGLLDGQLPKLEAKWRRCLGLLGRQVTLECHDGILQGLLRELSFDNVELEPRHGPNVCLPAERVLHLSNAPSLSGRETPTDSECSP